MVTSDDDFSSFSNEKLVNELVKSVGLQISCKSAVNFMFPGVALDRVNTDLKQYESAVKEIKAEILKRMQNA